MDRPRVTVYNTVSLDGRLTGFPVDLGPHYDGRGAYRGSCCYRARMILWVNDPSAAFS